MQRLFLALAAGSTILLSACGGGGDGGGSPPTPPTPPTPLPATVTVAAGTAPADVAAAVAFTNTSAALTGVTFAWTFGDGSSSSEASPSHKYEKAGDYQVKLTVTNSAGESRTATLNVAVSNRAIVQGQNCSGASQSGWCWQYPGPVGPDVGGLSQFLTPQLGWIQADDNSLVRTRDGGATWQRQRVTASGQITALTFADPDKGWVLTSQGQVWRTTDGGASWNQAANLPANIATQAVEAYSGGRLRVPNVFGSSMHAEAAVSLDGGSTWAQVPGRPDGGFFTSTADGTWRIIDGKVLRSTDLGLTQTPVANLPAECPHVFSGRNLQADPQSGLTLLTGEDFQSEGSSYSVKTVICRSVDEGKTWRRASLAGLPARLYVPRYDSRGIMWATDGALWILSAGQLYRSLDGGETWLVVPRPDLTDVLAPLGRASVMLTNGAVTSDAGVTWSPSQKMTVTGAQRFDDKTYQFVAGGLPFQSSDTGKSWIQLPVQVKAAKPLKLGSVALLPGTRRLYAYSGTALLWSNDDGQSWTQGPMFAAGNIDSLQFTSATQGWLIGEREFGGLQLVRTVDGAAHWSPVMPDWYSVALHAPDERHVWVATAVYGGSGETVVQHSGDGGQTWTALPRVDAIGSHTTLLGLDEQTVLMVQRSDVESAIYRMGADRRWSLVRVEGAIRRLGRQDASRIWAVGRSGRVLTSADAGVTWTPKDVGVTTDLNDVRFHDADHGWIVGNAGVILATTDGGKTWKQQANVTKQDLLGIATKDSKTVWVVGTQGTVLATGTGGD